ncbi:MAG: L-ascorbate metabolism protein UlaG (beta-lactamase superfamily) [Saprospiraceae bacterium]
MRKTQNKDLPIVKEGWTGNPINKNNQYMNLDGLSARGIFDVFDWKVLKKNKYAEQRKNQETNVIVQKDMHFLNSAEDGITWLGHATFLFCLGGLKIITDPVLYDIWPLQRFTDLPCEVDQLAGIDIILLSHNHRDHADKDSMIKITQLNPDAVIYTGLEISSLLKGWNIENEIVEAGWYQSFPKNVDKIEITYLPAKHWNRRYLHDLNRMLWGSFMINHNGKNIYFGADSGLGVHFEEIGSMYEIDVAILGIGAYEPIWFMNLSHTSPVDALAAKEKLKAELMIPMHYGTFDLSDEPIFNPKKVLIDLSKDRDDIVILDIGMKFNDY